VARVGRGRRGDRQGRLLRRQLHRQRSRHVPLANIRHRDPRDLPKASYLFILNRNADIIPAVARLTKEQAATYFMLGETEGTSAGGAHEAGKKLRVPGTNPFWFEEESSMGNRFLELLETCDLEVYLLNTGRIGGGDDDARSKKVLDLDVGGRPGRHHRRDIEWITDPDFGYEVAASCPGIDDVELLQPRPVRASGPRRTSTREIVTQLKAARRAYLADVQGPRPARRRCRGGLSPA
jgi:phosphoenolpyruvate carboxykinase (ATP)